MTLQIQKNKSPNLKPVKMVCDNGIAKKLNEYELTKFLNCHSTNLLIGAPGSGKSSLIGSFFSSKELLKHTYHNLFLFCPPNSIASMADNIYESIPNQYDELTYENLKDTIDKIKEEDGRYCNAIILDDQGAYLKNKETKKLLKELVMNRRHLRTSIFFLTQTYLSVDREIRKLFSNLFVFKVSKKELELIFDEQVEEAKDLILPISKLVFNKKYNFLFINTDTGRLFRNFDEIIIPEDE
jgi:AAA15 family ATPase/GTPase